MTMPLQFDTLAMPAYAWILALLFGVLCGLGLLAVVVSLFRCVRRRDYARLGQDQQSRVAIPTYMQYVYGGGQSQDSQSSSTDSNSDYTFVGVSIPLLQDVTRI